jgi:hypothetical protein
MTYVNSEPSSDVKDTSWVDVRPWLASTSSLACSCSIQRTAAIAVPASASARSRRIAADDPVRDKWTAFRRMNAAYPDAVHELDALVQQRVDERPAPANRRLPQVRGRRRREQSWTSA